MSYVLSARRMRTGGGLVREEVRDGAYGAAGDDLVAAGLLGAASGPFTSASFTFPAIDGCRWSGPVRAYLYAACLHAWIMASGVLE
jgi:hypothetical protein